ncbi:hypothetical protein [Prochlorococcus marinus]|uniref:hypothetical protein n=1 Tax=Prochlorococcus marinus TaxID=1219 RepID=UPI0001900618|nr:hypothetical protein [Prochlorococcus marinus]EEE40848.1 hypothetical protein P9202_1624 [Prochlorococcus marinus str. MIT 9202]
MNSKVSKTKKTISKKFKDFIKRNLKKIKNLDKRVNSEEISHDNYTLWIKSY